MKCPVALNSNYSKVFILLEEQENQKKNDGNESPFSRSDLPSCLLIFFLFVCVFRWETTSVCSEAPCIKDIRRYGENWHQ